MKMAMEYENTIREAMRANPLSRNATERQRWNWLFANLSQAFISTLYRQGLNDSHIDTALRRAIHYEGV